MSTRRALFFSFLDRYSGLVLAVVSSMVIARLLKPEEIGVFSVAMAMLAFAATFRDMGAGAYIVQAREVTDEQIKAVWTIQFTAGVALGVLVLALAYPAASFYDEPRLAPIMGVMALTYLTTPIGSITYALLMRDMRFQHVAVMRFSSALAGAVVSIGLAHEGHGPISLAWGQLVASGITALTSQVYRRNGQPWGFSFSGARDVMGFGSRITGTSFINTLVQGMPDFALGKLQGMTAAGLYSRSNGLVAMFSRLLIDAIYSVAVSHFASTRRLAENSESAFLRGASIIAALSITFGLFLFIQADPITLILYGPQWSDSVALTKWLAVAGIFLCIQPLCSALILAYGRSDILFATTLKCSALQIPAVILGSLYDLLTLGIAICASSVASGIFWLIAAHKVCNYSKQKFILKIIGSIITGLIAIVPQLIFNLQGAGEKIDLIPGFFVSILITFVGLLFSIIITKHPLLPELHKIVTGRQSMEHRKTKTALENDNSRK